MVFLLVTLLLLLANPVFATDYWIATTGSNGNACSAVDSVEADPPTDPGTYKQTIASAKACLSGGDRIIVKAGTYTDQQLVNPPSGSSGNTTVMMGDPSGARPTITYTSAKAQGTAAMTLYCTATSVCSYVTLKYLNITNSYSAVKLSPVGAALYTNVTVDDVIIDTTADTCWLQVKNGSGVMGTDHVLKNSQIKYCGKLFGGVYAPGMLAVYGVGTNAVVEYNEFSHNTNGVAVWYDGTTQSNVTIRYNTFHDMHQYDVDTWMAAGSGSSTRPASIWVSVPGGGAGAPHNIYGNLLYNNGCATCGADQVIIAGVQAGAQANSTSTANIYNNTMYNFTNPTSYAVCTGTGGCYTANFTSKNNIAYLVNAGFSGTASSNQTTDPSFVSAGSANFALATGSTAIDTGVNVGLQYNGSAPDKGAFETFIHASCVVEAATPTKLSITFTNNVHPPLLPASPAFGTNKFTARKAGANDVVTGATRVGDNQIDLTLTDTIVAGNAVDYSYSITSGDVTDSANIGGAFGGAKTQRLNAITNQACTNNTAGAPSYVLTQQSFKWFGFRGTEAAPVATPYASAPENTNILIMPGGKARLRIALKCTTADCPSQGYYPYYSCPLCTSAGTYTRVPDTYAAGEQIGFCGTSPDTDVPASGTTTVTELLTAAGTFDATGAIVRTSNAVPTVAMTSGHKIELEYCFAASSTAPPANVYTFELRKQDGSQINAYTIRPTMTVTPTTAGMGF